MNNFQQKAVMQGRHFHNESIMALEMAGFEIADVEFHVFDVGITLDAITNNKQGIAMAWEFKGSLQGTRPGLRRTDTAKKAIANAVLLADSEIGDMFPPLIIMTSHLPEGGDAKAMIDTAISRGRVFAVIDSRDGVRLQWLANASGEEIRAHLEFNTKCETSR